MSSVYWIECYSCGCSSEAPTKKELLGYCCIHGNDFQRRYKVYKDKKKGEQMTKKKVLFNIDELTILQLNELATATKKSRSALVREAVKMLWEINKAFQQKDEAK